MRIFFYPNVATVETPESFSDIRDNPKSKNKNEKKKRIEPETFATNPSLNKTFLAAKSLKIINF
jgi:hypothetical protein